MFSVEPPNGPLTPNDSAYFTGRFGNQRTESRSTSSHIVPQVVSGGHSMTDGTISNFMMDVDDTHQAQPRKTPEEHHLSSNYNSVELV